MDGKDVKNDPQDVQRWSAKRKAAVVLEILRGRTTPQDVARGQGLTVADVEEWMDEFLRGGEERLRAHPRDIAAQYAAEKKELHAKIGELSLEIDILKKANRIAEDWFRKGSSCSQ